MSQNNGVHGEAGATSTTTSTSTASTDASLNARAKTPKGGNRAGRSGNGRNPKWWLWSLIAVIVVSALVVGVNAFFTNKQNGGNGSASTGGTAAAKQADTVSIGLKLAPVNLDIRHQSGSALEQILIGNVYESLVSRGSDNKVHPGLAKSWEISDDGLTYTFHLNEHMTFSNGDALDADDVAWSINELKANKYYNYDQVKNLDKAEAVDSKTVKITLSAPDSNMLWYLTGRPGLVYDKDGTWDEKTGALGSGPYTVSSFDPSDKIVFKANPKYWGTEHKAKTENVVIRFLPDDNAGINALKSGDVQVLSPITATLAEPFRKDSNYVVKEGDGSDKFVLAFNMTNPKLADKRVRQAIRYGIDHQQIIASRGGVDSPLGGPIPKVDPGYEDLTDLYPHDEAKAKQLMAEAGYSESKPLQLTLTYANVYGTELGDQLKSQLKPIGIDLKINYVEFSTWLQDVHTNGDYDLSLVDHAESHDFYKWATPSYYYHYDSKEVQDLYAKALAATSDDEASKYLAQAAKIVSEDAPADWLFSWRVTQAYAKGVSGYPENLSQTVLPLWQVTYTPVK
ncbi:ABC transporter substrate-binding protein [Bifidobacterium sp. UTCIF-37]|uniref:ABC transporter substrate-binding protein n=1 Tax=unclassified Bifidobacterium TaxID=2608897 RepID=UPI00112C9D0E|nr:MULTISPECIES: ABC transporter substrate-binding protein [unclassified Bifidobacterium]TPF86245.1 ABC transporter substrate-binding protein [Bifidobacterium sp. UTCIF-37]TPF88611.1 ABC transporter substrate-binding protein [Bifidobacterium sp. UTCIF-38]